MKSQLLCGASKQCITPDSGLLKKLIGLKGFHFAGVLDDLYVRAVILGNKTEQSLFLAFDMTQAPCTKEIMIELSEKTDIPIENIFYFAIHTHAVPFNIIDMEHPEKQSAKTLDAAKQYTAYLHQRILEAVNAAKKNLQPAKLGYAWGESHVNVNRFQEYSYTDEEGAVFPVCNLGADPSKLVDRTLFAMRIENLEGRPIAFLVNYAMHNVATIWNDYDGNGAMGISSDIGGRISKLMEAEYEESIAIWSSSAAGDLNPLMINETILPDPFTGRTYELIPKGVETARSCLKVMSERHYSDVKKLLRKITCNEMQVTVKGIEEWSVTPGCDCIRHPDGPPEFVTGENVSDHTVRIHLTQIGTLKFCGVGAELFSSIGKAIISTIGERTVLITHDASTICNSHYVLDDEMIERCDASKGFAMVPGYDEYRCQKGVMKDDFEKHLRHMSQIIEEMK